MNTCLKIALIGLLCSNVFITRNVQAQEADNTGAAQPEMFYSEKTGEIPMSEVVATVNGVPVTQKELDRAAKSMLNMLRQSPYFQNIQNIPMDYVNQQALDTLVSSELMYQKAKEMGVDVTDEEIDAEIEKVKETMSEAEFQQMLAAQGLTEESIRDSVLKTLYMRKAVLQIMPENAADVSDEELKLLYDQMQSNLERVDDMIQWSQISIAVADNDSPEQVEKQRELINSIKKQLDEDADWETMVVQYSEDDGAKEDKGEMGYYAKNSLAELVGEENIPTEINGVSGVIESPVGFHIIKVTDVIEKGGYLSFEEARPMLTQYLINKKGMDFFNEYVEQLKKAADIQTYLAK